MNFCSRKYVILRFLLSAKAKKSAVHREAINLKGDLSNIHAGTIYRGMRNKAFAPQEMLYLAEWERTLF